MLKDMMSKLLDQHVGRFFTNLDEAMLKVSLIKGNVVLQGLRLSPAVFAEVDDFPFDLVHGEIDHLVLRIPWTDLMHKPIQATVDGVTLLFRARRPPAASSSPLTSSSCSSSSSSSASSSSGAAAASPSSSPQSTTSWEARRQALRVRRERTVAALQVVLDAQMGENTAEHGVADKGKQGKGKSKDTDKSKANDAKTGGKKGRPSKLFSRIKQLVEVNVQSVHVRFQHAPAPDAARVHPAYAVGVTLNSFSVGPVDVGGVVKDGLPADVRRSLCVDGLFVYCDAALSGNKVGVGPNPDHGGNSLPLAAAAHRQMLSQPWFDNSNTGGGRNVAAGTQLKRCALLQPLSIRCMLTLCQLQHGASREQPNVATSSAAAAASCSAYSVPDAQPHQRQSSYVGDISLSALHVTCSSAQLTCVSHVCVRAATFALQQSSSLPPSLGMRQQQHRPRPRPQLSRRDAPRLWWHFVVGSVCDGLRRAREADPWTRLLRSVALRHEYVSLYTQKLALARIKPRGIGFSLGIGMGIGTTGGGSASGSSNSCSTSTSKAAHKAQTEELAWRLDAAEDQLTALEVLCYRTAAAAAAEREQAASKRSIKRNGPDLLLGRNKLHSANTSSADDAGGGDATTAALDAAADSIAGVLRKQFLQSVLDVFLAPPPPLASSGGHHAEAPTYVLALRVVVDRISASWIGRSPSTTVLLHAQAVSLECRLAPLARTWDCSVSVASATLGVLGAAPTVTITNGADASANGTGADGGFAGGDRFGIGARGVASPAARSRSQETGAHLAALRLEASSTRPRSTDVVSTRLRLNAGAVAVVHDADCVDVLGDMVDAWKHDIAAGGQQAHEKLRALSALHSLHKSVSKTSAQVRRVFFRVRLTIENAKHGVDCATGGSKQVAVASSGAVAR
jgi:hypothetical protein